MNSPAKSASSPPGSFPDWAARLCADGSLTPGLRESYRQTLARFLEFCQQRRTGSSVAGAREFVELARLERAPSPARLQEWKDALNWYFRRGREAAALALQGVPPLARSDLGATAWEAALIAGVRERHLAWRTEQTYRGWLWRFVRWLESRRKGVDTSPSVPLPGPGGEGRWLAEAGAPEVKDFLSHLASVEKVGASTQNQALKLVEG